MPSVSPSRIPETRPLNYKRQSGQPCRSGWTMDDVTTATGDAKKMSLTLNNTLRLGHWADQNTSTISFSDLMCRPTALPIWAQRLKPTRRTQRLYVRWTIGPFLRDWMEHPEKVKRRLRLAWGQAVIKRSRSMKEQMPSTGKRRQRVKSGAALYCFYASAAFSRWNYFVVDSL